VLPHYRGMWSRFTQKSSSCCFIQRLWAQQLPTTIYSASAMESATQASSYNSKTLESFLICGMSHLCFFLSNLHLAKSKSEKPVRFKEPLGYHKPTLVVPLRYLMILLTAVKWDSLGLAWYLAHKKMLSMTTSFSVQVHSQFSPILKTFDYIQDPPKWYPLAEKFLQSLFCPKEELHSSSTSPKKLLEV